MASNRSTNALEMQLSSWPRDRLRDLADFVRPQAILAPDGFTSLPPSTDIAFWRQCVALRVTTASSSEFDALAQTLAAAVHEDLDSVAITRVRPGLYVAAELNAIHSPLTMLLLGISGAVVVSPREVSIEDFDPDVQLHHVSSLSPMRSQLAASSQFLREHVPAVVCGIECDEALPSAIATAFVATVDAAAEARAPDRAAAMAQVEARLGPLHIELDTIEEVDAYCASMPPMMETPPAKPVCPPAVAPFALQTGKAPTRSGYVSPRAKQARPLEVPPKARFKRSSPTAQPHDGADGPTTRQKTYLYQEVDEVLPPRTVTSIDL